MQIETNTRFHAFRQRLENYTPDGKFAALLWEFGLFGFKEGWACLFGGILLGLIIATKYLWPEHAWLERYDFLFLSGLSVQALLILLRMETLQEAKVILIFHIVGTLMELFKTDVGSWSYPENCFFHIGHVPLFSGFMYASVGSYIARITRIFDLRYAPYPAPWVTYLMAGLIYLNFFTHHYMQDFRLSLFIFVAMAYGQTWVYYKPHKIVRRMPLLTSFGLITLFIWLAENVGTFGTVWVYPHQAQVWQMVKWTKFGSWFLLMIVSFVLVSVVHKPKLPEPDALRP